MSVVTYGSFERDSCHGGRLPRRILSQALPFGAALGVCAAAGIWWFYPSAASRNQTIDPSEFAQALKASSAPARSPEKKKSVFQAKYYDLLPIAGSSSSALEQARSSVQQITDDLSDATPTTHEQKRDAADAFVAAKVRHF